MIKAMGSANKVIATHAQDTSNSLALFDLINFNCIENLL